MKIGIVSDIHTEFWQEADFHRIGGKIQKTLKDADIVLLAGDIGMAGQAQKAAKYLFPDKPICIIAGNHEFYGEIIDEAFKYMRKSPENVHFLHREEYITNAFDKPLRVLGATLWTDFNLFGNFPIAFQNARRFPDFNERIFIDDGVSFTIDDALQWHKEDMEWIFKKLDEPFDGITVLMTHHAPVSFSSHPNFDGDMWNPCFSSRLENSLIRDDLDMVVWGHTHYSVEKVIDNTIFVSSQVGYPIRKFGVSETETGDFGVVIDFISNDE